MALKGDIKTWLKEMGLAEDDIDKMWKDLKEINTLVARLDECEGGWRRLDMRLIKQIPGQKEKDLKSLEDKRIAEENAAWEARIRAEAAELYEKNFESIMVGKIESGELLSENEVMRLIYDYEVDRYDGECGRWAQLMQSVVCLNGRHFSIDWQRGLTENQENQYSNQPYEVVLHTYQKTVTVKEWRKKA